MWKYFRKVNKSQTTQILFLNVNQREKQKNYTFIHNYNLISKTFCFQKYYDNQKKEY